MLSTINPGLESVHSLTADSFRPVAVTTNVVYCCNGATPDFFLTGDLGHRTLGPSEAKFVPLPKQFNGPKPHCSNFYLEFMSERFEERFRMQNGTLGCQCKSDYRGDHCDSQSEASSTSKNSSLKIFLYLAIVPLCFGLVAAVGGFFCRMCCCDLVGCIWPPCNACSCQKDPDDESMTESEFRDYAQNIYNRTIDHQPLNRVTSIPARQKRESTVREARIAYRPPTSPVTPSAPVVNRTSLPATIPAPAEGRSIREHSVPISGPPPPYEHVSRDIDLTSTEEVDLGMTTSVDSNCPIYASLEDVPQDAATQTSLIVTVVPKDASNNGQAPSNC